MEEEEELDPDDVKILNSPNFYLHFRSKKTEGSQLNIIKLLALLSELLFL
jgi:hypothetical protein